MYVQFLSSASSVVESLDHNRYLKVDGGIYVFDTPSSKKRVVKALKRGYGLGEALRCANPEVPLPLPKKPLSVKEKEAAPTALKLIEETEEIALFEDKEALEDEYLCRDWQRDMDLLKHYGFNFEDYKAGDNPEIKFLVKTSRPGYSTKIRNLGLEYLHIGLDHFDLAEGLRTWFNWVTITPSIDDLLYWVDNREFHPEMDCFKKPYYKGLIHWVRAEDRPYPETFKYTSMEVAMIALSMETDKAVRKHLHGERMRLLGYLLEQNHPTWSEVRYYYLSADVIFNFNFLCRIDVGLLVDVIGAEIVTQSVRCLGSLFDNGLLGEATELIIALKHETSEDCFSMFMSYGLNAMTNEETVYGVNEWKRRYGRIKDVLPLVSNYQESSNVVDYMSRVGTATKAFNRIVKDYEVFGEHNLYAAVNIANLFGMEYGKYLSNQERRENYVHDLGVNLPLVAPNSEQGLKGWLLKYAPTIELIDAMLVARRWLSFTAEEKELAKRSTKKALEIARSYAYSNIDSKVFAQEAAKWGVEQSEFRYAQEVYVAGLSVPMPFNAEMKWQSGEYVGSFLPRNDVRVGFFGHYTNCCQHFTGVGSSSAISSVKDSFSQLFVVEKAGEILCGSWTWVSSIDGDGYVSVCFDNVEAKGLSEGQEEACRDIYLQVAKYLVELGYHQVSVGINHTDLSFSDFPFGLVAMNRNYSGYSDAAKQWIIATNPSPTVFNVEVGAIYVRGLLETDLPDATLVARACYPVGWQEVSTTENSRGLGLVVEGQLVGYAIYDPVDRYIADMAVLAEHRKYSKLLIDELLSIIPPGEEWSADCRESTSLRLMRVYARRGKFSAYREEGVSHSLADGDDCHQVFFTM